jgi:hypothetical protein
MLYLFNEISVIQADVIKSFAIFFLLIIGNFVVGSIFTCYQINHIKSHKWLQRFIAFFLFYFLVGIVSDTGKLELIPPIEKLINSLFYFLGFLVVMRLDMVISMLVLLLVFIIYFLELNKDFYLEKGSTITDPEDKYEYNNNKYWITFNWPFKVRLFPVSDEDFTIINKIEKIIYYCIVVLLVVGFIAYGGEIHDTVSKSRNLTWFDVIGDTDLCKLKDRRGFWHYFKIGLGIKL